MAHADLAKLLTFLTGDVLPHERSEEAGVYPVLAERDGADATAPLVSTHREIERLVGLLGRLVAALPDEGPGPEDHRELRRLLYGLHAVLQLHFAQEEELYVELAEAAPLSRGRARSTQGGTR